MKTLVTGRVTLLLGVALCAQSSETKAMAQQCGLSARANAAALRMYAWIVPAYAIGSVAMFWVIQRIAVF